VPIAVLRRVVALPRQIRGSSTKARAPGQGRRFGLGLGLRPSGSDRGLAVTLQPLILMLNGEGGHCIVRGSMFVTSELAHNLHRVDNSLWA